MAVQKGVTYRGGLVGRVMVRVGGWWARLVGRVGGKGYGYGYGYGLASWERLWFGFVGKVMVRLGGYGYG